MYLSGRQDNNTGFGFTEIDLNINLLFSKLGSHLAFVFSFLICRKNIGFAIERMKWHQSLEVFCKL